MDVDRQILRLNLMENWRRLMLRKNFKLHFSSFWRSSSRVPDQKDAAITNFDLKISEEDASRAMHDGGFQCLQIK